MRLTCPRTGKVFSAHPLETYKEHGATFVAVKCKVCDAAGRVKGERGFDKDNMQVHVVRVQ